MGLFLLQDQISEGGRGGKMHTTWWPIWQRTATLPDDLAFDAIGEVGPTGHFFGVEHTQERYETAFYESFASDWRNFEAWELDGGKWTATRAHGIFKDILDEVTPPPMEPAINEGLLAFVAKRKQEGGVATDY